MDNHTTTPYADLTRSISAELAKLRTEMPDTLRGFSALAKGGGPSLMYAAKTSAAFDEFSTAAAAAAPASA